MSAPRVGLITCAELPDLSPDDRPVLDELVRLGLQAEPLVWDDPAVDWRRCGALVLRSTWDYHLKPAAFHAWLDRLESLGAPLWNPPAVVRANADKSYLLGLAAAGATVVPTMLVRHGRPADLSALLRARGWSEAVVKPAVSGGGFCTRLVREGRDADQEALDEALAHSDALIQPYLPEIEGEGEWSFVFIDGRFSHALLKTVKPGDFRVQEHFGGAAVRAEPEELLARAESALAAAPGPWLYARVDGVRRGSELLVMEIELIEPFLYLALAPGSALRLAEAIAARARLFPGLSPSR